MDAIEEKEIAIQVKNVSKSFRMYFDKGHLLKEKVLFRNRNHFEMHEILNDVSFDIYKGESVGLIGKNGCGKSTALKLLTKIIYPDSGSIEVKGRVSSLLELGAGFHPDLSGRDNIYINASIFGLKRQEIDARIDEIIAFSELGEYINNPVRTYSSGMYMRLAFSVAINVEADILLVDEILAVGDAMFQTKCLNKIEEIKKNGTTIVLVSHSMDQIKMVCDRCIWINNKKISAIGDTADVVKKYLAYMGRGGMIETEEDGKAVVKNYKIESYTVEMFDVEDNDKTVWHTGEKVKIRIRFKYDTEIFANVRMEIVRLDGIKIYSEVFNNEGIGYLIRKDTCLELKIDSLNLLMGKFYFMLYLIDEKENVVGKIEPFAEIDVIDSVERQGMTYLSCRCSMEKTLENI
ncbi:MAG: ATP-binding cassette domain-containing protein [Lachnospiraceae bacterium]|nr:ATP-binding cassette domain-containing protein [Lachnospiraceae bacterium]